MVANSISTGDNKKGVLFEKIIVWEILFFNGAILFQAQMPKMAMIFYPMSCALFFLTKKKGGKGIEYNLSIIAFLTLWILFNSYIIHGEVIDLSYIEYISYMLGTGLAVSVMDFQIFKYRLRKYFAILVAFSILAQIIHNIGIGFENTVVIADGSAYNMTLFFFNTDSPTGRLSSLYWEPGQYQIVVFFFLSFYYKELQNWRTIKEHFWEYGIIISSIILSLSTTAYIVLGLFLVGLTLTSKVGRNKPYLLPVILMATISATYLLWNSSVIQDKFNMNSEAAYNSYNERTGDNLALLRMISDSPIVGFGAATKGCEAQKAHYGNTSQSNGWLRAGAENGSIYLLTILVLLYKGFRRKRYSRMETVFVMLTLIVSQCNEGNAYLPYLYVHIFKYRLGESL